MLFMFVEFPISEGIQMEIYIMKGKRTHAHTHTHTQRKKISLVNPENYFCQSFQNGSTPAKTDNVLHQ